ncbi:MAG TPA: hypothetical protein VLC08_08695, partial [Chitinolyticbacter sp.]|nr:hypothetical protein [Chitinolyticbacter sp.]
MSQSSVWWVFLPMLGVLLSLGWVGWRFFYAAPGVRHGTPVPTTQAAPRLERPKRVWPKLPKLQLRL